MDARGTHNMGEHGDAHRTLVMDAELRLAPDLLGRLAAFAAFMGFGMFVLRLSVDGAVGTTFIPLACAVVFGAAARVANRPRVAPFVGALLAMTLFAGAVVGGFLEGGLTSIPVLWLPLVPVASVFLCGPRTFWVATPLTLVALGAMWRHTHALSPGEERLALRFAVLAVHALFGAALAIAYHLQRSRTERLLRHHATHDSLTGLPGRDLFFTRLEHALARTARTGGRVAVFVMDLDQFKAINDRHGHLAGDAALREVAARLRAGLRKNEEPYRLAGDEFLVLVEDAHLSNLDALAARIEAMCAEPVVHGAVEFEIGVSTGYAVSSPGVTAVELIEQADLRMYDTKHGRNARHSHRIRVVSADASERSGVG